MKHTPGPWNIESDPCHFGTLSTIVGGDYHQKRKFPKHQMVIQVGGFSDWKEQEANARLIVAAPELLNALTVLVKVCEQKGIPVDAAKAAISRATGTM